MENSKLNDTIKCMKERKKKRVDKRNPISNKQGVFIYYFIGRLIVRMADFETCSHLIKSFITELNLMTYNYLAPLLLEKTY